MAREKKSCRRDRNDEKFDRLSELPEPILHHIFSFLGAKDCMQFRASSKRLNQVWTTLPYLDLGRYLFHSMHYLNGDEKHYNKEKKASFDKMMRRRKTWFTFVDRTVKSRKKQGLTIKKFQLGVTGLDTEFIRYLNRWIESLVKYCKIEKLLLFNDDNGRIYDLPPILLSSATVTSLTLFRCKIPRANIKLVSLRKLHMEYVYVDDEVMRNFISACRGLEYLELSGCYELRRLQVSRLCKLKVLNLDCMCTEVDKILVEAPNLEKLKYWGDDFPHKINFTITCTRNLKNLQLLGHAITPRYLADLVSNLLVLEVLSLGRLHLEDIEISSRSLKSLALFELFGFHRGFCEAKIDAPNLKRFYYRGYLSQLTLSGSLVIPEVDLVIEDLRGSTSYIDTFNKLVQFLCKFDYSETMKLSLFSLKKVIFPMEKRVNVAAPLPNIKQLVIEGLFGKPVRAVMAEVIDNLLWFSPGLRTLLIVDGDYLERPSYPVKLSAKFTHDKFAGIEDECCDCINLSQTCWRHSLKHLKYELEGATVDAEDDRCLRTYFTDNAKLLEDIDGSFGPP